MSKTDRTDGVYLLHIVESLQDVLDFLEGKDYEEFIDSKLLINAVVRCFEIAGEATKNLTMEFRDAHADIDWSGMAGFRDVQRIASSNIYPQAMVAATLEAS